MIEANDFWLHLFGCRREELVGHSLEALHPWEGGVEGTPLATRLREEGHLHGLEVQTNRRDGTTGIHLISAEMVELLAIARFEAERPATLPTPAADDGIPEPLDRESLLPWLREVQALLRDYDPTAQKAFDHLKSRLSGADGAARAALHRLDHCLEAFDFQGSQTALGALANHLELTLDTEP